MGSEDTAVPDAKRLKTTPLPVVLGTSSKWRRALFQKHFSEYGSDFMAADIDEKAIRAERPEDMTVAIANAKADALIPRLEGREVLLVCMDQVVACDGSVREKPENEAEAKAFLESYRQGKGASCINGMVVHNVVTGRRVTAVDIATAFWKPFPDSVIEHLIAKGEIFTSAGGFTIEDEQLSKYVDRIEGTQDAIEGLPVAPLRSLLQRVVLPAVTHVLFDLDGLLVDTESVYTLATQAVLDKWDRKFTWDIKAKMMGRKALEAAELCLQDLGLGPEEITAQDFVAEVEKRLQELFPKVPLMPGVDRLIRHLHRHGVPMAVATSSSRPFFDLKTTLHKELFSLMQHVVTSEQVAKAKPDPELFLTAAKLFSSSPEVDRVLVFEDAPNGVEAGLAAGMQVVHVPDANLPRSLCGHAHCTLSSIADFRPEEWGLPPFNNS